MTVKILTLLAVVLCLGVVVFGQGEMVKAADGGSYADQRTQAQQDKKTAKIKEQVKKIIAGDKVTKKVRMKNGTTYRGFIGTPTEDTFVVQDKAGGVTTVKYSDVDSIDKKDVPTALKIGLGAAAGI